MGRRAMSQLDDGSKRTGPAMLQPWCASMQAGMRGGRYILRLCQGRVTRQKKTLHAIIRKAKYLMQPMLDKTELTDPSSQKQLPASSPATMVKNHSCSVAAPATGAVHQLQSWLQAPQY